MKEAIDLVQAVNDWVPIEVIATGLAVQIGQLAALYMMDRKMENVSGYSSNAARSCVDRAHQAELPGVDVSNYSK